MLKHSHDLKHGFYQNLAADIPAGIVVFLVALPLSLGVAVASGAPLLSGLIAGIVGGLIVGAVSKSPFSVSGPAAGMTVIVLMALQDLGSFEAVLLSVFFAGFFQVGLGLLGAGCLGSYFPNPVIRGMLFAIGLILILKQLPHAAGLDLDPLIDETYSPETPGLILDEIGEALSTISLAPLSVCLGAVLIIYLWDAWARHRWSWASFVPGPVLAVLWGIGFELFSRGTALDLSAQHLVSLPVLKGMDHVIEQLESPDFSRILDPQVIIHAAEIAMLASLETLLSIEALDRLDPIKRSTPRNRELIAQGIGNIVSSLIGGLPVTSVIVRSSTNINAGARSKMAAILHGGLLLVSLLFFVTWINLIPLAALAGILLVTGLRMAHPSMVQKMWRRGGDQFIPFVVTVGAILVDDLLKGILIGTIVGVIFIIKSNFHSGISLVSDQNNYLIRFRKDVTFLNKVKLRAVFDQIPADSFVVIDGTRAEFIDRDILDCISDFSETARSKNIVLKLRNVLGLSGPVCHECLDSPPSTEGCMHHRA